MSASNPLDVNTNTNPTISDITIFQISGIRFRNNSYNKIQGSAQNRAICLANIGRLIVKIEPNENKIIIITINILGLISFFTRIR